MSTKKTSKPARRRKSVIPSIADVCAQLNTQHDVLAAIQADVSVMKSKLSTLRAWETPEDAIASSDERVRAGDWVVCGSAPADKSGYKYGWVVEMGDLVGVPMLVTEVGGDRIAAGGWSWCPSSLRKLFPGELALRQAAKKEKERKEKEARLRFGVRVKLRGDGIEWRVISDKPSSEGQWPMSYTSDAPPCLTGTTTAIIDDITIIENQ